MRLAIRFFSCQIGLGRIADSLAQAEELIILTPKWWIILGLLTLFIVCTLSVTKVGLLLVEFLEQMVIALAADLQIVLGGL